jgi:hypothetical protein
MLRRGFSYIIFLIFLTILIGIIYSYSALFIRQHKILLNSFQQFQALKFAESGINYSATTNNCPQSVITGVITISQLLNLPALTYTFQQGSFKLLKVNSSLFSIGQSRSALVVFQRKGTSWQHFSE